MKIIAKLITIAAVLGLITTSSPVFAATTPSFGLSASYAVLASTYTNTTPTTITGDIGFTTAPAVVPTGVHANYGPADPYAAAGTDQATAAAALSSQPCTFTFAAGAINLSTDLTHGPAGIYTPGVYCSAGAMDISGALTLSGSGTYIFRPGGALTSTVGASVVLSGASVCDIFWTPTEATTLAADTTFLGTVIDDAGITVGANTTWTGRALAFGGTVTTDTNTISAPTTCTVATPITTTPIVGSFNYNTITVIKQVINDNGGTAVYTDFPLFLNGNPVNSGQSQSLAAGIFTVTEINKSGYTSTFTGNCDANGQINHGGVGTGNDICTLINNDVETPSTIVASTSTLLSTTLVTPISQIDTSVVEPFILAIAPEHEIVTGKVLALKIPTFPDTGFRPPEIYDFWITLSAVILTLVLTPFILALAKRPISSLR